MLAPNTAHSQMADSVWRVQLAVGEITLVAIDSTSLKEVGIWPWTRPVYTQALTDILESGARTVAINIEFSTMSDPEADRELEATLARYGGKVILPIFAQKEGESVVYTSPLPGFARHTTLASSNLFPDGDGIVRRARLAVEWRDSTLPSLSAILAGADDKAPKRFYVDFSINADALPGFPSQTCSMIGSILLLFPERR